jgi:hypothetical protein
MAHGHFCIRGVMGCFLDWDDTLSFLLTVMPWIMAFFRGSNCCHHHSVIGNEILAMHLSVTYNHENAPFQMLIAFNPIPPNHIHLPISPPIL